MRFDIRTAALDDLLEQRVRLAASLLGAYRMRASISPWDGTSCHLLIAATDDAYGRQAMSVAMRRGTKVLGLGEAWEDFPVEPVNPFLPASALSKEIFRQLEHLVPAQKPDTVTDALPAICRLAMAPLRGQPVRVDSHGRIVLLRPQVGRVYAASHSDLLATAERLSGTESLLEVDLTPASTADLVSSSIESFLMRAAYRAADRLPPFPEGRYQLSAWPDLGILPSMSSSLHIAKLLIKGPMAVKELSQLRSHDIDQVELNACLWAFAAADLLKQADSAPAAMPARQREPRLKPSMWSSIARRFGLLRA